MILHSLMLASALLGAGDSEPPADTGKRKLLVLEFAGMAPATLRLEVTAQASSAAKDAARGTRWDVMTNESVRPMLMSLGEDERLCEMGKCTPDHLRMFGADAGLLGEVMVVDKTIYVTINLHDVRIGSRVDSVSVQADSIGELFPQVRKSVGQMLKRGLGMESQAGGSPAPSTGKQKPLPRVLLFAAERASDAKIFTINKTLTQRTAAEILKDQGFSVVTDTSWLGKEGEKSAQGDGAPPVLETREAAQQKSVTLVVGVRTVVTSVVRKGVPGHSWIISARVRTQMPGRTDFIVNREHQEMFECPSDNLDDCSTQFRTRILEPLMSEVTAPPPPLETK